MGSILSIVLAPQNLLAILAALAVFATVLTVTMPIFQRDELSDRMRSVVTERERIRQRERERLAAEKNRGSLRQKDGGMLKDLVDRLNLKKALADESTFADLRMAGYRKQSHIYVFLFFRLVLPVILLAVAGVYVFVIADLKYTFFMKLAIVLGVGYAGFYAPNLFVKNQVSKRQLSIKRAWPDSLDLMLICVESGMSMEAALRKVAVEVGTNSAPLAEELVLTNAELSYLQERRQGYENLASRTGLEGVKSVSMALIQAERYGTPLGNALRVLAQENRDLRMSEAEKKAAALPPKLTVPMIIFFLPVLFAVIMGPAIIRLTQKDLV